MLTDSHHAPQPPHTQQLQNFSDHLKREQCPKFGLYKPTE